MKDNLTAPQKLQLELDLERTKFYIMGSTTVEVRKVDYKHSCAEVLVVSPPLKNIHIIELKFLLKNYAPIFS